MQVSWMEEMEQWQNSSSLTEKEKAILKDMTPEEAEGAFGGPMTFGTAGLRAVMGLGTRRMNVYTVAQATAGLAKFILSGAPEDREKGVAIAYDSRHNSELFSVRSAEVLSSYGIRVYLYPALRPTPMLSYAVRRLGCIAGINITASHNAKEYNGYKVYWEDGAQIGPEQAEAISALIASTEIFGEVPESKDRNEALIQTVPAEVEADYIREVLAQRVDPSLIPQAADTLDIVYTPLHGTGATVIPEVLKQIGLTKIHYVEEQMEADGDFPSAGYPNPENPDVFTGGIRLAEKYGSDLLIATDPDADRVGTMVRKPSGEFVRLTGNQMGALLLDYIISSYQHIGKMPKDAYVVKSFVSTEMATAICEKNGVTLHNVLTGFKYIGETIKRYEEKGKGTFLLGFEESYGYLKGTYARDKDAVVATMLICEMAAYYKLRHMTLYEAMQNLYEKYGYYAEEAFSVAFHSADASERMKSVMRKIREKAPETIGNSRVASYTDYGEQKEYFPGSEQVRDSGLPVSDALRYVTENGVISIIRPSGTEPKIKIYLLAGDPSQAALREKLSAAKEDLKKIFE